MFITTLNNRTAFDEVFDDFFNRNFNVSKSSDYKTESDEDGVTLTMNVPGYNKKLIDVSVSGDQLTIEGQSNSGDTDGFKKVFTINDTLDSTGIEASVVDGILSVNIPYLETVQPKRIEVKVR
jgi:HSP20 family molecular chaperone IbpA